MDISSVCALYAGTDVVSQNFSSNLTPRRVGNRKFSLANVLLGIGVILVILLKWGLPLRGQDGYGAIFSRLSIV